MRNQIGPGAGIFGVQLLYPFCKELTVSRKWAVEELICWRGILNKAIAKLGRKIKEF
jgi:hypothetical protein